MKSNENEKSNRLYSSRLIFFFFFFLFFSFLCFLLLCFYYFKFKGKEEILCDVSGKNDELFKQIRSIFRICGVSNKFHSINSRTLKYVIVR